eukprot:SAG31_NODE_3116_length_4658_cov_2.625576_2_plen_90_part_00
MARGLVGAPNHQVSSSPTTVAARVIASLGVVGVHGAGRAGVWKGRGAHSDSVRAAAVREVSCQPVGGTACATAAAPSTRSIIMIPPRRG